MKRLAVFGGIAAGILFIVALVWIAATPRPTQMVSAAHPLAAQAGYEMLERGGSAVDAAIAIQLVLTLVEPQSSGIGGGAFMVYWNEADHAVETYDGREKAPMGVTPDLFLDEAGQPLPFPKAVLGGHSVGVPGVVALMWKAHQEHGVLDWAELFEPAITLAENGFAVTPRLNALINWSPALPKLEKTRTYFFLPPETQNGDPVPLPVGHILKNPAYAQTLRTLAEGGADAFYTGPIARQILDAVHEAPAYPSTMTARDLADYEAKKRAPVCAPYRKYTVCGAPPPTSGSTTVLEILGLLEPFFMSEAEPGSADAIHLITEASRLAYADRDLYLADPDFVDIPLEGLLNRNYLRMRARNIHPDRAVPATPVKAGHPPGLRDVSFAPSLPRLTHSTTHFSIVDAEGNAVSMTSSIEAPFGSHLMAGGFMLNNQLTDFSFVPERDGKPVANRVEPGKRPRSSMSPMVVLDGKGEFYAAVGSPGGSRIIAFVAQTLVGVLDWDMTMQQAVSQPHHVNRNGPLELEAGTPLEVIAPMLRQRGHEVEVTTLTSGLHGIRRLPDGKLEGGADPRREGIVLP